MNQHIQYLQVEPTTRCNYTCGFCAGRHMAQLDIEFSTFTAFIDTLTDLKHIELQGEGEPLLHPQLFDMVNYARLRFPQVKISFITNGSLFTNYNIEKILAANIDSIMISIESANEHEFQSIRGGKLSRVIRGIEDLIEKKKSQSSHLTVGFIVTILKETVSQITAIAKLYTELHMDGGIITQPLQQMPAYKQYYDAKMVRNIPAAQDRILFNNLIASDRQTQHALLAFKKTSNFYSELFSSTKQTVPACSWLMNGMYLSVNGMASSCSYIKNPKKFGYGIFNNNIDYFLGKRKQLFEKLSAGEIPQQCLNCNIATRVASHIKAHCNNN